MRVTDLLEHDIFGFDSDQVEEKPNKDNTERPIRSFNIETMMNFLSQKSIGVFEPVERFVNEMQWGDQPGAVKLEVDSRLTFYIKKWGVDKTGENRWVTKRMFQLNRNGYGGYEDLVAHECHEALKVAFENRLDAPMEEYQDLERLVLHISDKMKKTAKNIFLYDGIKKMDENNFLITLGVRAGGIERPDQRRVEENITHVSYDKDAGVIRIMNYNVESPTGKAHSWKLMPMDLDVYFFPTQRREEISECVAVRLKYY